MTGLFTAALGAGLLAAMSGRVQAQTRALNQVEAHVTARADGGGTPGY